MLKCVICGQCVWEKVRVAHPPQQVSGQNPELWDPRHQPWSTWPISQLAELWDSGTNHGRRGLSHVLRLFLMALTPSGMLMLASALRATQPYKGFPLLSHFHFPLLSVSWISPSVYTMVITRLHLFR
jgi:hypothetical protein